MKYRISTSNKRVRCTTQLAKFVSAIQSVVLTADVFHLFTQNKSACLSVCVCATFIVFTDCESCTRPVSTNPRFVEAPSGLTRGTCFVESRLEMVAVAGLLHSWCVLGAAGFFRVFFFSFFFIFERTEPAVSMRPACLIYLSTSNEAVFWL